MARTRAKPPTLRGGATLVAMGFDILGATMLALYGIILGPFGTAGC